MSELVIAEKPSVARSIAEVLGAREKHDGYLQGHGFVVSWCIGHLIASALPEAYDEKYKIWKYEDLPIIPDRWKYSVIAQTGKQFVVLKKLMHDPSVTGVVCATDAGREGELIFRLVYEAAGCKLPVRRLWISSLEKEAIAQGFGTLKDASEYDSLYQAALCRDHADWLVGINATRLFSLLYGRTLKVGRVMSPTLAMIVNREESISAFHPEKFYTVQLDSDSRITAVSDRYDNPEDAEAVRLACDGKDAVISRITTNRISANPPRLFDLTTLQREANKLFGFTAQQTLDCAQSLYEKQLITYPRTDSQYMTKDSEGKLPKLALSMYSALPFISGFQPRINVARVINNAKVSDHHAIIPTWKAAGDLTRLPAGEQSLLTLIAIRLICAVSDPCVYEDKTISVSCEDTVFTAKARNILQIGWKAVWNTYRGSIGNAGESEEEKVLPFPEDLTEGSVLRNVRATVREGVTTPPRHYTEASILAAMESAGNTDMPEDAERKGIGTPATRAGILEKLVSEGLIERKGSGKAKALIPTEKGASLIAVLPEQLQSPLLTAEWEQKLKQIEKGEGSPEVFLKEINEMITSLVQHTQRDPIADTLFPKSENSVGKCPNCGAAVIEKQHGFFCSNRTCPFRIWKKNRLLMSNGKPPAREMIQALLTDGQVYVKGLQSKNGRPFNALLMLDCAEDGSARISPVFNH